MELQDIDLSVEHVTADWKKYLSYLGLRAMEVKVVSYSCRIKFK
jgi:hypothetical protein